MVSRESDFEIEEIYEEIPSSEDTTEFLANSMSEKLPVRDTSRYYRYYRKSNSLTSSLLTISIGNAGSNSRLHQKSHCSSPDSVSVNFFL